ncbi:2',3'-cyclic-nucleotide 2'-phosphodiesterase / 3'-nucleotidase [Gracilibacillus orientalis]|uniref:2',3'-cyclic-nucleotide 2'-phosphodiesterase / 3'-nucleotidase n=1 Tax=Gracilibacillus orientalis TaxID=334253 RepID=A0A1I4NUZ4_9BACI|nr:bifunctional UDP-sugar hydrolase/5'-nucleotidase [Gracilibacillus orientalis]SFM19107.1 2',3'-cyclic-nucleotide 2'-phosphodiesterase / 3'-nucleotidase [Gracilibacillus orientalis]
MKTVSICVTSDVHGYIMPTNYRNNQEEHIGLAKTATIIKKVKEKNDTILIDNGDFIQGSPFTYYFAKKQPDQPSPMINVANQLNYDLAVIGNHEFNYGLQYLQEAVEASDFPWLSANIIDNNTHQPFLGKPYMIKEIAGIRFAILGLTTHYIPNWEDPNHIENLTFEDACKSAKNWVTKIRKTEAPDVMVVSYHGGLERDPQTGELTEDLTGENQGYQICQEVEGIDILITGHQHRFLTEKINGVTVVQPGNNGQAIAEITLEIDQTIQSITSTLHYVDEQTIVDSQVENSILEEERAVQAFLDQTITTVKGDMEIHDPMEVRLEGHPFINYINQLQLDIAKADISCTALFHDQSPGFPEQITMRDIVSNYIYPNTLKVLKITGHDIKDAIEKSVSYFQVENNEMVINPTFLKPKPQPYNYDMWQGIYYEVKASNPIGERVITLEYQGQPLDLNQEFQVVMNNYRASGGGDYHMFKDKEVVKDIPIDMTELIADDLLKRDELVPNTTSYFRILQ